MLLFMFCSKKQFYMISGWKNMWLLKFSFFLNKKKLYFYVIYGVLLNFYHFHFRFCYSFPGRMNYKQQGWYLNIFSTDSEMAEFCSFFKNIVDLQILQISKQGKYSVILSQYQIKSIDKSLLNFLYSSITTKIFQFHLTRHHHIHLFLQFSPFLNF